MAYSLIEKKFYKQIHKAQADVKLHEYIREDWTFHGKGLWCTEPNRHTPFTVLGSSNFGRRSYERDFESQVYLFTTSAPLQQALQREFHRLKQDTEPVGPALWARRTRRLHGLGWQHGYWIRPVTRMIASFL